MSLYKELLGEQFGRLPPSVQRLHDPQPSIRAVGRCSVERGSSFLSKIVGTLMRFPPAAADLPLRFELDAVDGTEHWRRHFGSNELRSVFRIEQGRLREQMGPLSLEQSLELSDGELWLLPHRAWFLGIPLPQWMVPKVRAVTTEQDGRYHFDVAAALPLIGQVVRYRGWLEIEP